MFPMLFTDTLCIYLNPCILTGLGISLDCLSHKLPFFANLPGGLSASMACTCTQSYTVVWKLFDRKYFIDTGKLIQGKTFRGCMTSSKYFTLNICDQI